MSICTIEVCSPNRKNELITYKNKMEEPNFYFGYFRPAFRTAFSSACRALRLAVSISCIHTSPDLNFGCLLKRRNMTHIDSLEQKLLATQCYRLLEDKLGIFERQGRLQSTSQGKRSSLYLKALTFCVLDLCMCQRNGLQVRGELCSPGLKTKYSPCDIGSLLTHQ